MRCDHKFWRLYDAQKGRCFLCGHPFLDNDWATDEHVKPQHLGGRRGGNILLAHGNCNRKKGGRPPLPCEVIYLHSVNLMLPLSDMAGLKKAWRPWEEFVPLRARLTA